MGLVVLGVTAATPGHAQTVPTPLPADFRIKYMGGCFYGADRDNDDLNKATLVCRCTLGALERALTPAEYTALVEASGPPPASEAECKALEKTTPDFPQAAAFVQGPNGSRCEIRRTVTSQPTQGATFSVLGPAARPLAVTCAYEVRDRAAIEACTKVLDALTP